MKRSSTLFLALILGAGLAQAAGQVQTLTVHGDTVHVTSKILKEFIGLYRYEKQGQPTIELKGDGTGHFQPHGIPAIPIRYWLKTDAAGKAERAENPNTGSYRVVVVLQYGPGGGGNYPEGGYDMWYLTWDAKAGCFNILGERFKC